MKSSKSLLTVLGPAHTANTFPSSYKRAATCLKNGNPQVKSSTTETGSLETEAAVGAGGSCSATQLRAATCPLEALGALHHAQEWNNLSSTFVHPPCSVEPGHG